MEYQAATPITDLIPYVNNARTHSDEQIAQVAASILEFGFTNPILIDEQNSIIAGHGRLAAARKLAIESVPTIRLQGLSEAQKKAYVIADNSLALNAGWDVELLQVEIADLIDMDFDTDLLGFDDDFMSGLLDEDADPYADGVAGSMTENYGQPPFSVLDTRKGDWAEKKKKWRELIGDNGESRDNVLEDLSPLSDAPTVSLLDPVMAELMVSWFGFSGGKVLDPFAGDSIFGFVSSYLGMKFTGIELRQEQAELNQQRTDDAGFNARYICDTSENLKQHIADETQDLIFSCPPYADLEVYSDNPQDLSAMTHDGFFSAYKRILESTYGALKQNRFAVIVMGEVRGKSGKYIGTIPKTIEIMESAGYSYYNEIILVNNAGTLPLRAGKYMQASRKIGKMHQNILVFVKGDPSTAANDLGEIDLSAVNYGEEE